MSALFTFIYSRLFHLNGPSCLAFALFKWGFLSHALWHPTVEATFPSSLKQMKHKQCGAAGIVLLWCLAAFVFYYNVFCSDSTSCQKQFVDNKYDRWRWNEANTPNIKIHSIFFATVFGMLNRQIGKHILIDEIHFLFSSVNVLKAWHTKVQFTVKSFCITHMAH